MMARALYTLDPFDATSEASPSTSDAADALISDPIGYFGSSYTRMHSMPLDRQRELQLAALGRRFQAQAQRIPMLGVLTERQHIQEVSDVHDVAPLLFEHTMYKSYPGSLLEQRRFDVLTGWLNKLTRHDLSNVSTAGCETIDDWLDRLAAVTSLDPLTSSGSTGTMSFLPRDRHDWDVQTRCIRVVMGQDFGRHPAAGELEEPIHTVWPSYSSGHVAQFKQGAYLKDYFARGLDDHFHALNDSRGSADLMWLAARLRAAAARGDRTRVDVPASLLDRRAELEAAQQAMAANAQAFTEELLETLKGKRVFACSTWNLFYDVAVRGLAEGRVCRFAEGSVLQTGGGAKGMVQPDDWLDRIEAFFGITPTLGYGMTEITSMNRMCEHRRYHFNPWLIPFVLDVETGASLPHRGRQTGRAAYFDLCMDGMWGGIVTGDRVTVGYDGDCPCGRTTPYADHDIYRYSERQGGNDKITCAATPEAHAEAMDYLLQFNA
jgi:hypothetical protein